MLKFLLLYIFISILQYSIAVILQYLSISSAQYNGVWTRVRHAWSLCIISYDEVVMAVFLCSIIAVFQYRNTAVSPQPNTMVRGHE